MKTVILCGGLGTRLAEETDKIPKPIVKIGKIPIIHHIINYYKFFGFNDFILCAGYKHKKIFEYAKHRIHIRVLQPGYRPAAHFSKLGNIESIPVCPVGVQS